MFSLLKRHQLIVTSLLLCLLSIHLIITDKRGAGGEMLVGTAISVVAAPLQSAVTTITGGVSSTWSDYIALIGIKEENNLLREELAMVASERARLLEEVASARRVKALLGFKEERSLPMVAARIIGTDTYGLTRTVTIDLGESDGVQRNMAVVTHRGIVGKIIELYGDSSMVLLATDPRFRVDGVVQRNRVKGIVEGSGGERLVLKYIRQLDNIEVGDRIISSGLGGIFAKGLTVGEVAKVEVGDDSFFQYVEVIPSVDLDKMEEVLVITGSN
ncbi:MAG: rod shape-determining protein MreC [Thermodesulfobacteriota bacterium]